MSEDSQATITMADGTRLRVELDSSKLSATERDALLKAALKSVATTVTDAGLGKMSSKDPSEAVSETGIVGQSEKMLALFKMLDRIRNSHATVLITGENGTGKELVAKSIHRQSSRVDKNFVATNCSAFNDNLLESELFGHRRGSFTGAVTDKPGLFEIADKGTFFLDEVGDMSPALQVKLLRVLQEGVFMPVGATESKKVDVRIIAATNRDLNAMVKDGSFREDLFYRLHVVGLHVPPLRDRSDDIAFLVDYFLGVLSKRNKRTKQLTEEATKCLMAHRWPGNVRELENEIERVWVLSGDDSIIGAEHLSPSVLARQPTRPRPTTGAAAITPGVTLPQAVEALERTMIEAALQTANGNKTKASEALGISRRNLIRKVQSYGLG